MNNTLESRMPGTSHDACEEGLVGVASLHE